MTPSPTNFLDAYQGFDLIFVKVSERNTEYGPRIGRCSPALRRCPEATGGISRVVFKMNVNMEYIAPSPAP